MAGKGVPWDDQAGTPPGRPKKRHVMAPVAPVAIPAVAPEEIPSARPEGADADTAPTAEDTVPPTAVTSSTPSSQHGEDARGEKRAADEQLGPTPEFTPQISSASADTNESNLMSLSPTRQAYLEREREAWRNATDQDDKKPRVGQIQSGPTVDEGDDDEGWSDPDDFTSDECTWTAEQELAAKWAHLTDVIEANDSFDIIPYGQEGDALLLSCKWVIAIRDGAESKVLKARLCARDLARKKRDDLFAPGENALTGRVIDYKGTQCDLDRYTLDVQGAYNTIPEPEHVVVKPPQEWLDWQAQQGLSTAVLWKMKKLLPGRRVASKLWVKHVGEQLKSVGFEQCPGQPQFFHNKTTKLTCSVHMDDIHGCGPAEEIDKHLTELAALLPLKKAQRHTTGDSYTHLKRTRHLLEGGTLIVPNDKHVREVLKRLDLENCKPAAAPMIESMKPSPTDSDEPLPEWEASEYRSLTSTLLYASHDMSSMQFTLRVLTSDMKYPSVRAWERLKHAARYLAGVRGEGTWFEHTDNPGKLLISTDTDWAGDKRTRKSASCTVLRIGKNNMYSQVKGQQIHAQSSGEAEFYGMGSGISAGIGLKHVMDFIEMPVDLTVESDSSAARAVLWRSGVGKIRHLEVKTLWAQQLVEDGQLDVKAVAGEHNVADIGTKILPASRLRYLKEKLGVMTLEAAKGIATQKQVATVSGKIREELLTLIAAATRRVKEKNDENESSKAEPEPTGKSTAIAKPIAEVDKALTLQQIRENLDREIGISKRKLYAAHCWAAYAAGE